MEIRTADWRSEKHIPVIHVLGEAHANKPVDVEVVVGEKIPHPNTADHHINWIELYFSPEGGNTAYALGRVELEAHGEMQIFTEPRATFRVVIPGSGTLHALALCNLHGLWESTADIHVK